MTVGRRVGLAPQLLELWCRREFGAGPVRTVFTGGHLGAVVGVELDDRRRVVIKVRPTSERLLAVVEVQRRLFAAGFPCSEPLAGPAALGPDVATAQPGVVYDRDSLSL